MKPHLATPQPGSGSAVDAVAVRDWLAGLQSRIVAALEAIDGQSFRSDAWQRAEGGGGITRVLEEGGVFERAGVLFSHVHGTRRARSAARSPAAPSRRWASPWCCIRAIPTCPPCT